MPKSTRPANRARRHRQDLDAERARAGNDQGRQAADRQLEPSHGDPPRSRNLPNTSRGA